MTQYNGSLRLILEVVGSGLLGVVASILDSGSHWLKSSVASVVVAKVEFVWMARSLLILPIHSWFELVVLEMLMHHVHVALLLEENQYCITNWIVAHCTSSM